MPNYKTNVQDVINIAGYQHIMKPTDKFKVLLAPEVALQESLHDAETAAVYQVPTGKTLLIFFIDTFMAMNATSRWLSYSSDEDGVADQNKYLIGNQRLDSIIDGLMLPLLPKVPSAYYVTKKTSLTTDDVIVYGIEENT